MMACSEVRCRLALYVDHEVAGPEALDLEAHLTECRDCRRAYEDLRSTVDTVRSAGPLYEVPDRSYPMIETMVQAWQQKQRQRRLAMALAPLILAGIVLTGWLWNRESEYGQFAAQAHRNYARAAFPLDVSSGEPQIVSDWLQPRVPFRVTLPNYPQGGRKRYMLAGARLMQYHGEDVAFLAYEMDGKPISLLISSSSRILPSAGESYQSGGLTFYFSSDQGLRIISWKDKGLTYAQVSDLNVKGAESCSICHSAEGDRHKFEGLGKRL